MLTLSSFRNLDNPEYHDWESEWEKAYDNRVEDWGDCDEDVQRQYENMDEWEFATHFLDSSMMAESVGCSSMGYQIDWNLLRRYMSYLCGIQQGYYEDNPESFIEYYNSL